MTLANDVVKIRYIEEGYLPDYPYHLISDEEMCDAFLRIERSIEDDSVAIKGYFADMYPCPSSSLESYYTSLVNDIIYHLDKLKQSKVDKYTLPDWVYSYMLGSVVGPNSTVKDIHDCLVLLDADNMDDIFTSQAAARCYDVSKRWIRKLSSAERLHRPPTIFGEPHVIKSLRLAQANYIEDDVEG